MKKNNKLNFLKHYGKETDENKIILGDNIIVCELLAPKYKGKVKCIYIDPPYNNGEVYYHYDDAARKHTWIQDMSSIIKMLFNLLSIDGSLWISIDENEVHHLRVLCEQILGKDHYVTTIVWQQRTTRENRKVFSNNHEYILVIAKNVEMFKLSRNLLKAQPSVLARYKNPDNDPRGPWQSVSVNVQAGHAVKSQFYEIQAPNGKIHRPPNGRCWIYNKERMLKEIEESNIWFGVNGNGVPRRKKFLNGSKKGLTPETLWLAKEVGTNKSAKKHLLSMFPEETIFDTPKPETLIKRIVEITTNEGDLVLDAFLGSGTTAAVCHKMNRKYIGIDASSKSIEYTIKRMELVIEGEDGGISDIVNWKGGGGFSHYIVK